MQRNNQRNTKLERWYRAAAVNACVFNAEVWAHFQIITLTTPQRDRGDARHSALVDRIGTTPGDTRFELKGYHVTTQLEALVDSVYPAGDDTTLHDPCRCILSTHNVSVDEINQHVLSTRIHTDPVTLHSHDTHEDDPTYQVFSDLPDTPGFHDTDYLNHIDSPGQMPPHKLVLKVGAIAKIMRNISPKDKLFNGTRVKIDAINTRAKTVVVTRLHDLSRSDSSSAPPDTQQHIIGQINFEHMLTRKGFCRMIRKQIPLRLCYAMTVHNSQGQTMPTLGLDARLPAFTHGLFYVGIGRATTSATIHVLCAEKDIIYDSDSQPSASVMSIVWPEMLPEHWRATTDATQPATTADIAGTGGNAVPVDDYCALPTRITGELQDDIDLE